MKSYKDELLQEKIDNMDDLDKIQLQNKMIYRETIKNKYFMGSMGINIILMILTGTLILILPAITNLIKYGLEYEHHILSLGLIILGIFVFFFLGAWIEKSNKTVSEELDEDIDEFIRENTD